MATDIHLDYGGFKLVFEGDTTMVTDDSWWCYIGPDDVPALDDNDVEWYDAAYEGDRAEWVPAHVDTPAEMYSGWIGQEYFGTDVGGNPDAEWIWDLTFDEEEDVFLRSMAPAKVEFTVETESDNILMGSTSPLTKDYPVGDNAVVVATPEGGYQFAGWYEEVEAVRVWKSSSSTYTFPVVRDIALIGVFELIPAQTTTTTTTQTTTQTTQPTTVTLTVTADFGGTSTLLGTSSQTIGSVINLVPTAFAGYEFTGWDGDIVGNTVTMDASKTINAKFQLIEAPETVVPEAPPVVDEVIEPILDETLPEAAPIMPQTAGIPMDLFFLGGASLLGLGLKIKRRR
jgi:hypothetical protein